MPKPFNFDDQFHKASDDMPFVSGEDERIWLLLSVYMDGEATPAEAAEVEALLAHDPVYAREFRLIRQAGQSARLLPEVEPPAKLREAIFAATTRRPSFARQMAQGWQQFRRALSLPTVRYGVPALATVALAALFFTHHPASTPETAGVHRGGRQMIARGVRPFYPPDWRSLEATRGSASTQKPVVPVHPRKKGAELKPLSRATGSREAIQLEPASVKSAPPLPPEAPKQTTPLTPLKKRDVPSDGATRQMADNTPVFSPQPHMDALNQRPMAMLVHGGSDLTGPDAVTPDGEEITVVAVKTPGGKGPLVTPTKAPIKIQVAAAQAEPPAPSTVMHAHTDVSKLAPDSRYAISQLQLKQQAEVRYGGMDREVVENAANHEARFAVLRSR